MAENAAVSLTVEEPRPIEPNQEPSTGADQEPAGQIGEVPSSAGQAGGSGQNDDVEPSGDNESTSEDGDSSSGTSSDGHEACHACGHRIKLGKKKKDWMKDRKKHCEKFGKRKHWLKWGEKHGDSHKLGKKWLKDGVKHEKWLKFVENHEESGGKFGKKMKKHMKKHMKMKHFLKHGQLAEMATGVCQLNQQLGKNDCHSGYGKHSEVAGHGGFGKHLHGGHHGKGSRWGPKGGHKHGGKHGKHLKHFLKHQMKWALKGGHCCGGHHGCQPVPPCA